jgi:hypothetical protein
MTWSSPEYWGKGHGGLNVFKSRLALLRNQISYCPNIGGFTCYGKTNQSTTLTQKEAILIP